MISVKEKYRINRRLLDKTVIMLLSVAVAVLSGDLLYLYYAHSWNDPIKLIEYSEVVILWVFVIGGISNVIWQVKKFNNDGGR